ncbi:hypothetical protein PR048_015489 [Dryococelus australis]|uniref:Uncharacterized protein n=1 Tax=Dryococelus australis TaxID=614101 RepID=A0ABQ9HH23_9NEOP|nr:hypothetical protein PR048_015489 [Dryococelus australis]
MDNGSDRLDNERPEKIERKTSRSLGQRHLKSKSDQDEDVLSENSTREDMNNQQFVVTLSPEEWSRMKPERMYKCVDKDKPNRRNRAYNIIPPNSDWTDTINEHFWDHISLYCALSFKRAKVYKSGTQFLTIFGRCKSCSSVIAGSLQQEPDENGHVLINFKYRGTFVGYSTGSKRILKGTRRRSALEELVEKHISTCTIRREEAQRMDVLRLAKSRELKSRRVNDDPILAVGKLKYSAEYYSSIREIGLDPFHVYYWTPAQLCVYQEYCKNHPFPTDATGGITAKLKRLFGNVSGVVYLYSVAVHDHEAGVKYTVANMLSEFHNNLRIHHFLESWLQSGAPVPKEAVCDHSVALLSGLDNCPKEKSFPEGMENEDETCTDFMKWAHQIISEVKGNRAEEEGDHDNLHFLPDILFCIAKIMKFLPLWSAIMVPKNVHLPTTVDRFLETHLRSLDAEMKLAAATSRRKKVLMQRETDASQVIQNALSPDISQNTTREDGSEIIGNNQLNNSKYKTGIISAHNPKCFACSRGDFPTGAHTCSVCGTPVLAAFSECSTPYDRSEEGYGEKLLCVKCADKVRTAGNSSSAKDI